MMERLQVLGIEDLAQLPRVPRAVAIGNFDGVHKGHQLLLAALDAPARRYQALRCALTFHPHPSSIVAPERTPSAILTLEERIRLLRLNGADEVVVLRFDSALSRLSPLEFAAQVLVQGLSARHVAVGANFRFAHRQEGNVGSLSELGKSLGFAVTGVPLLAERGLPLSSSQIRRLVASGAVARAARMLGRPFSVAGPIVKGRGVGGKQTVPTLNLALPDTLLPADGVYVTQVHNLERGGTLPGITNIGLRPTFDDGHPERSIETFVLGTLETAPAAIQLDFLAWLRGEQRFENPYALKSQILHDVARAKAFHRRVSRWRPTALRTLQ